MGGNIFTATHPTVRLDREDMEGVSARLHKIFDLVKLYDIPSFSEKDSFGDLDMVAITNEFQLYNNLKADDYIVSKNGNVVSMLMPVGHRTTPEFFQCDIICFPTEEEAKTAVNYFAYNDLGNLIGRLYHSIGFKYGHDGLSYVRRDGNYQVYTMPVSTNIYKILSFIGLCPEKFQSGFKTLEEIFEFVASSPYYHPSIYLLENRNHTSRVRDRKRKTYMEFLKWSETHPKMLSVYHKPNKEDYLFDCLQYFRATDQYGIEEKKYEEKKICKALLNGDIVREITGLEGVELGKFMKEVRDFLPDHVLIQYNHKPEDVKAFIEMWYERKVYWDGLLLNKSDV